MEQLTFEDIAIRPESDIYASYKRLAYRPWYAVAEFVDNSTQNFFDHRAELRAVVGDQPYLTVDIFYDPDEDGGRLTVVDNAFGMNRDDIQRAVQLAKPPTDTSGRSEYGMGLKTSACWLGPRWEVESTQLGSDLIYKISIDLESLSEHKPESVQLEVRGGADRDSHYTIVDVRDLAAHDRVFRGRTLGKIKEELASIYRRDVHGGDIRITFNGDALGWESDPVFVSRQPDGSLREWSQDLEFEVEGLPVTGWVAIRGVGGKAARAGFSLFRRGRLITGGIGQGWKPREIFGSPNSFMSQRIFGELELDSWPISHTKDAFAWDGRLENGLIDALKTLTTEYVEKAKEGRIYDNGDEPPGPSTKDFIEILDEAANEFASEEIGSIISITEVAPPESEDEASERTERFLAFTEGLKPDVVLPAGNLELPRVEVYLVNLGKTEPYVVPDFPANDDLRLMVNLDHPFLHNFIGSDPERLRTWTNLLYVETLIERTWRIRPELNPSQLRAVRDQFLRSMRAPQDE